MKYTYIYFKDFFTCFKVISNCCCNETPSAAGRNQDYFYPHFNPKVVFKKALSCKVRPLHLTQSCSHSIRLSNCYKYARFTQYTVINVFAPFS